MKVTPTPGSVSGRRIDRVGDPLEGLVNLFDLSLVLAVGLLLAALSSAGAVGLLGASGGGTPIPGQPSGGENASGKGTAVGTVYRLENGTYVFAPQGTVKQGSQGTTGATGAAPPQTPQTTPNTGSGAGPTAGSMGTTPSPTPPAGGAPGGGL